jgi:hypothetical protein
MPSCQTRASLAIRCHPPAPTFDAVVIIMRTNLRGFRELHIDPGSLDRKPTLGNSLFQTGPVFVGASTALQERRIDRLNMDTGIRHGSTVLAILTRLRAALSGSESGRSAANFTGSFQLASSLLRLG